MIKNNLDKYKVIYFGTPEFAVPCLKEIAKLPFLKIISVITNADKPSGRGQKITASAVKKEAEKLGLPVCQPKNLKSEEFVSYLKKLKPDLAVIVSYGKLIPQSILELTEFGFLNVHASLLPKYRGASPIQAALLGGEKETGATIMKIDEGLDTGPIVSQKKIKIEKSDNYESLYEKLSLLGADLLKETLLNYLENKIVIAKQNSNIASYCGIIDKNDGKLLFVKSADFLVRQIKALNPWPGTYAMYAGKRLKIIKALRPEMEITLKPGLVNILDGKIIIGCGHGILELLKIQLEGSKALDAHEFIIGHNELNGAQLI